jgi:hypothetical protein
MTPKRIATGEVDRTYHFDGVLDADHVFAAIVTAERVRWINRTITLPVKDQSS